MAQPLTREHLNAINETIQIDKTIRPILNRAETAMIDLGDRKERWDELLKRMAAIKQGFFPNGRA
jgi:arsenate reductase-like glutaredoxin family protein|tara:strand:- start:361 stop:555 length:195 start_codon:yes stop_codon:yes gene_type:complete